MSKNQPKASDRSKMEVARRGSKVAEIKEVGDYTLDNMPELKILYRGVEELIPYSNNARLHSESQIDQIACNIKANGWTNPIITDGKNGIIGGHGRLRAARKLGMTEVPTIEISGWTEDQKRAYIIWDNKSALNAEWDYGVLKTEFEALKIVDFDLSLTGFTDQDEMGNLLADPEDLGNFKLPPSEQAEKPLSVAILFLTEEAQEEFGKLIGQDVSYEKGRANSIWFSCGGEDGEPTVDNI